MLSGPPLAVPYGMSGVQLLPRKITNLPSNAQNAKVHPLIELTHLPSGIEATKFAIAEMAQQMDRIMYADLWQMLTRGTDRNDSGPGDDGGGDPGAPRREAGPTRSVLLRLNDELLSPLIDIGVRDHAPVGIDSRAPEELRGQEIKVEFVSMLHQAQQVVRWAASSAAWPS
jgi:hypothetical protein